ncbi:Vi polysaccharide biosynthesis UDP-N-acetylglucosamine C-6 dehydrogenase TviB [Saprospiraceae bacterium]|nr:Vi polysaccharide biosynthesis UDP-N-acetylglucosamine C-6 dehydrogenase TviB [Saprospiraceae bacterium]
MKIAVVGLGYVGLPLAVEFGKKHMTVGFDINQARVNELNSGIDSTLEVANEELKEVIAPTQDYNDDGLFITTNLEDLKACNFYIITVPTPTDKNNRPVLTPLKKASESIGKVLKKGDYVVYESTVYPGATEEECIPVLEQVSGLKFNEDFFVGYSPERINPGDKKHTVTKILKVTSGSTPEAAKVIDEVYKTVITAGTYIASSLKVAEAAKVIENSQRDINIAFVNELSKIFNKLGIDTLEVLEAAGTKWNFLPFRPGLVGGHCIGVDPYYLAQKAQEAGYHPEIILAGRRLNDTMGNYVASQIVKLMINKDIKVKGSKTLMLGITFKENCPDIRNTKAVDVYKELEAYGTSVDLCDPWANPEEVMYEYGIHTTDQASSLDGQYDAVVLTVAHKEFLAGDVKKYLKPGGVLYDVKSILPKEQVDGRL